MRDEKFLINSGDEIIITLPVGTRFGQSEFAPTARRKALIRLRQPEEILPRRIRPDDGGGGGDPHAPVNPPAPLIQLYRFYHKFERRVQYLHGSLPDTVVEGFNANQRQWQFYAASPVPPRPGQTTILPFLRRYRHYAVNFDGSLGFREYTRRQGLDLIENYDTIEMLSTNINRHVERIEVADYFGGNFSPPAIVNLICPVAFSLTQNPQGYYVSPAQIAANQTGDAANWTFLDNPDQNAPDYAFPG